MELNIILFEYLSDRTILLLILFKYLILFFNFHLNSAIDQIKIFLCFFLFKELISFL
jgi:hypothetical protein